MATTDNMKLVLPVVSTTPGPDWSTAINEAFETVDTHDHSSDKGVKVTPSGLNINAELDFNNNKATNIKNVNLEELSAADTASTGTLQRVGANLFWVSGAGSSVQITSGSSVISAGSGALSVDTPGTYPYSITTGDTETVLLVDTSSAARTLNLPAATNAMTVWIKDSGQNANTNNITIVPDGTDTIDGNNSNYVVNWDNASVTLISDGTSGWWIL